MTHFKKTAIAMGVAQIAMMYSGAVMAQAADAAAPAVVVVTGQRAALQSAQKIKQNSDEIVDSIVADDIGKLPDRSVTEVLQRVVGVTIDRTMSKGDPEHYSVEGSSVSIRGLSYVRSEMNGRDSFSANGGRSLNFEDVPPELMAGVDIYKNPSAEQVEGAIGGLVNLRTAMPFDYKGFKGAVSGQTTYSDLKGGKSSPSGSLLLSNRWKTQFGEFGALVDVAHSESGTRTDAFQVEPYYPRTDIEPGKTVYIPKGAQWRTLEFDRKRQGTYGAFQWKPSKDLSTSLTYFKSKYKMQWDEQAIFAASSPYAIQVRDATYDDRGALLTGTLSQPGGIDFGDDTRTATRESATTDIGLNVDWRIAPQWRFKADFQRIRATTDAFDSTVATAVRMPKQRLDLTGDVPSIGFDAGDIAHLSNPNNYYWAFTQEHLERATAESKALKADLQYDFDHPVLRDVRFGVRMTERDSVTENSNPSYNWAAITQPWQGELAGKLAYLSDPRFAGNTHLHTFDNFFNGKASVPSVIVPDVSQATGYPGTYAALHKYYEVLCRENGGPTATCNPWKQAAFGNSPEGINDQSEKTKAFYTQVRFGFDNLAYPIDGNVGVRYVKTDSTAFGYTVFTANAPPTGNLTGTPIPVIRPFAQAQNYDNSYSNVLPSLNLRMKVSDKLQFRFAYAGALSRPDFSDLQGYTTLSQSADTTTTIVGQTPTNPGTITTNVDRVKLTGTASGNPMLKPTTSRQLDLTAEWYFAPGGSITAAVFNKQLKDIVIKQVYNTTLTDVNGAAQNFTTTGPVNGAKGHARGIELAWQQYFENLPEWASGFGMQANFTFVDSKRDLYNPVYQKYCSGSSGAANLNLTLNGCDTNGQTFGDLPLQNLSRQSANIALMFDRGPVSARMAYNWRSKSLQNVNVNGTQGGDGLDTNPASPTFGQTNVAWGLPTWADSYGQLDASLFYKFSENLSVGLEAQNLTDAKFKQLMQQNIGMKGRAWFVSGPRYTAQVRYTF